VKRAILILAAALGAAAEDGIRPRADVADFPVYRTDKTADVGAALLTPDQVRGSFSSDLNRGYLVLEVGVYPKGEVDLGRGDFALRAAGTQTVSYAVSPKVIAGVLQKAASKGNDVTLYPTVGVGYESGPSYDPATGTQRRGGWTTGAGVGVGVGGNDPRPASTGQDRKTMELELSDKGLPEGKFTQPVAGYLYFPIPARKKPAAYELEYMGRTARLLLPLQPHKP
jgi:hypothetical protein